MAIVRCPRAGNSLQPTATTPEKFKARESELVCHNETEDSHFTKPVNVDHNAARCSKTADEKTGLSCALLSFPLFGLSGICPPDVMLSRMQFLLHLGKPVSERESDQRCRKLHCMSDTKTDKDQRRKSLKIVSSLCFNQVETANIFFLSEFEKAAKRQNKSNQQQTNNNKKHKWVKITLVFKQAALTIRQFSTRF